MARILRKIWILCWMLFGAAIGTLSGWWTAFCRLGRRRLKDCRSGHHFGSLAFVNFEICYARYGTVYYNWADVEAVGKLSCCFEDVYGYVFHRNY